MRGQYAARQTVPDHVSPSGTTAVGLPLWFRNVKSHTSMNNERMLIALALLVGGVGACSFAILYLLR